MRSPIAVTPALVLAIAGLMAPSPAHGQAESGDGPTSHVRSTGDGVYTSEQAARGRVVYEQVCSECHAVDWYRGEVVEWWDGQPVWNLYDFLRNTMPDDHPRGLLTREYVDMLAYILELNGQPPGEEELPYRPSLLSRIVIEWPR